MGKSFQNFLHLCTIAHPLKANLFFEARLFNKANLYNKDADRNEQLGAAEAKQNLLLA